MESFNAFLDDYYAECDEHLTAARRALTDLEASVGRPGTEGAALEELFRIYHSIKGISGMVELREAEQLAHELEHYLRALRQRETLLTTDGVDTLIDGTQRIEQVIAARRAEEPIPATADIASRIGRLLPSGVLSGGATLLPASGPRESGVRWRITFLPSRDLADRGIGVDVVRKRIAAHGDIVSATPRVTDDGNIEFVFELAANASAELPAALDDLELTIARLDTPATPVETEPLAAGVAATPVAPSHFVRVDLTRLDDLMRSVGDLVISRARLADSLSRVERHVPPVEWRAVQENAVAIDRQLRALREGIMRVRLVPVGEIFRRMPFVVRDLARSLGKRVEIELEGQSTEIDKYVIERMMDPVLHLVRNAISHGIEAPDERIAAGKRPDGAIRLRAATSGDMVIIEIADDGRGIDADAVARRARAAGLPVPHGALDNASLLALICAPGFSTREESDRAAGRGVGMNVVKTTVEQLAGSITLDSTPGRGTRFTIALPLTLAIADALVARVGAQTFAVPQGAVREVLEVAEADVRAIEQSEVVSHRDAALPIVRLARVFGLEPAARDRFHVFVTGQGPGTVGLAVDRVVGQREIVVRAIADPLVKVDGISGATDLGDGRVVLILDPPALARAGRLQAEAAARLRRAAAGRP